MRQGLSEQPKDAENLVRLLARVSVGAGGMFWMIAAFAGPYVFNKTSLAQSMRTAAWPFLATIVILAIGWFYEQLAAVLLTAASGAVLVWGVIYGWEPGLWLVMVLVLIGPMMLAAALFLLAAHAEVRRTQPALSPGAVAQDIHPTAEAEVRAF